jgi:phage repressor protein C with HTH and peptisase S24 domain
MDIKNVKEYLDGVREKLNLSEVDFILKIESNRDMYDKWIKRNRLPDKWVMIIRQLSERPNIINIPKLSITVSAGGGNNLESIDAFDENGTLVIDAETLHVKNYSKLKAIRVDGYSMIPILMPDSWVIFNNDTEFKGDGLYVLNWRNILMVKQIQLNSQGLFKIISANSAYESYTVDPDDQSIFHIIGKVIRAII